MKHIIYPLIAIVCLLTSCKSDSEKMIEISENYIVALDSIQNAPDKSARYDQFIKEHGQTWIDLIAASKGDSIYAKQDLELAKPKMYEAILKHLDTLALVFVMKTPPAYIDAADAFLLTTIYNLELPYSTTVEKIQDNGRKLNMASVKFFTKLYPSQAEMVVTQGVNEWMEKAVQRKQEIEAGNLYDSKFLK